MGCSPICAVLGLVGRRQGRVWAQLTAGHRHTPGVRRGPRASLLHEGFIVFVVPWHSFRAGVLSPTHVTLDS